MRVLGISGSLRGGSHNTKLLRAAGELLLDGVEFVIWDGLKAVPPYDEDDDRDPAPAAVARMRGAVAGADAVLFATPEYNSSVPGQLKNALDWTSRPRGSAVLEGKPVATLSASPSPRGAARAHADLRKILGVIGADVRGQPISVARAHEQLHTGRLADAQLRDSVQSVLAELLARPANFVAA